MVKVLLMVLCFGLGVAWNIAACEAPTRLDYLTFTGIGSFFLLIFWCFALSGIIRFLAGD